METGSGAESAPTRDGRILPEGGTAGPHGVAADGASPHLTLGVLHLATPSAPARWEASPAAFHQPLCLLVSRLWSRVCLIWSEGCDLPGGRRHPSMDGLVRSLVLSGQRRTPVSTG